MANKNDCRRAASNKSRASCAQVRMRKLRARNQQDSLPKAERCRFLNKPQLSTAARRISPATDRNTIPGTAARFRRYCQSRLSEARRRRFCSWRTSLRSSDGQSRGETVRGPTSLPVDQLPQQAAQALSRLSHSGHRWKVFSLAPPPVGGCLYLVANQCVEIICHLPAPTPCDFPKIESNCDSLKEATDESNMGA